MESVHQDSQDDKTAISSLKEIPYTSVLLAIAAGKKIGEACREAGISRSSLFWYVKQHPEAITNIVESKRTEIQALYTDIADTERRAIETYLRRIDALLENSENLKLSELEVTINYLRNMRTGIEATLGASDKAKDPGAPYLEGLTLKKVTRTTETLTFADEGPKPELIDAEVTEP